MNDKIIEVKNLSKSFDNNLIINNISFDVYKGEIISIVGTSGCGKSTILNILSNTDKNYNGLINIKSINIGYMYQEPALFPWFTIKKNAYLACDIKKYNNYNFIDKYLVKYGLKNYLNMYPSSLSGGMKQRLSLIRTLSISPEILLLDEPFGALDYQTRLLIIEDLYKFVKENNITVILITHDISEAISLSDRVIVLSNKPCNIKKIYNIDLINKSTPLFNRQDDNFSYYYENIGKDLDLLNEK